MYGAQTLQVLLLTLLMHPYVNQAQWLCAPQTVADAAPVPGATSHVALHMLTSPGFSALQYLANYASTGKGNILDTVRQVVALHRERYVFPVGLSMGQPVRWLEHVRMPSNSHQDCRGTHRPSLDPGPLKHTSHRHCHKTPRSPWLCSSQITLTVTKVTGSGGDSIFMG